MAKSYINDRIIFKNGKQADFIFNCKSKLDLSWIDFAKKLKVNCRTLRDWSREKKRMPYHTAISLSKIINIKLPTNIKIMKWSDHLKNISVKGGASHFNRYGKVFDEDLRKKAWRIWWNSKGKYNNINILQRKIVHVPKKNALLAEFVGILLGDGSINNNSVRITLDSFADGEYILFVCSLIKRLFKVTPNIYKHRSSRSVDITIHRKNLVDFLINIGLKNGNKIKQNTDIPDWIKDNLIFSVACIRGLMDTDGCLFRHSYKINGKVYCYNKLAFTNKCPLLLVSVGNILIKLGFCVRMTKDGNDIRIENKKDILKYMDIIGISNKKFENKII